MESSELPFLGVSLMDTVGGYFPNRNIFVKMFTVFIVFICCINCGVQGDAVSHTYEITILIDNILSKSGNLNTTTQLYADVFIKHYENRDYITVLELDRFINAFSDNITRDSESNSVLSCDNSSSDRQHLVDCLLSTGTCLNSSEIFRVHGIESDRATLPEFIQILPAVAVRLQQKCVSQQLTVTENVPKPSPAQVWGIGFLCVTLINLCALLGMIFIPLMNKAFYKPLLMFMVALGVGTLTGSSLLFLIPECFEMTTEGNPHYEDYIWKSTTVIGGIYMFFLTERILQSIIDKRKVSFFGKKYKEDTNEMDAGNAGSVKLTSRTRHDSTSLNMSFQMPEVMKEHHDHESGHGSTLMPSTPRNESHMSALPLMDKTSNHNGHDVRSAQGNGQLAHITSLDDVTVKTPDEKQAIKSVAWMVVFGDGVHNFIDGLSIGAAFTNSILAGVSISIAVICEELPHELGDFAILLSSGMSIRQALLYNFLSACMCYLGLAIGILIGELTHGSPWIFAIAGGMFLYIALVDMLPEVNHTAQEEVKETGKMWPSFLIQNAGLLTGYGLMIFLASFTGKIDFGDMFS